MAIHMHPDGTFRRYPPAPTGAPVVQSPDEYSNPANWKQKEGARPGIQIHRDGKTMRNVAPTPR